MNHPKSIEYIPKRFGKSPAQTQKNYKRKQVVFSIDKNPGDRVDRGMMIGTQKRIQYFPGFNVGINPRDKSLYAMCAGTIYYSIEKVDINRDNPLVEQNFILHNTLPYYNKYIHVIPDKLVNEFRLIELV
ncbi:ribosomal L27-like protein [Sarcoptes scabiei]|uniref:Ribosomal L27-like protein n=1 Tax=Sarcoptes scabiei TaxID=52283 RepID=A0A131ZUE9_SARSC|nr:ribosomal L27-like protein [Sarcoptes scabiei]